eukprot:s61_g23.t3
MKTEFISSGHILGAIRSHSLGSGLAFHSPVTMDQQAQMLSEICGADVDSCSAALYQCEGDADQAATLLIEAAQLLQPNSPVRQTEVSPLSQLLEMGYGRQLAEYALQTCNGDLQIAAEFLQDSSPASAPAPARQDDMRTIGVCAICTEPLTPSDAAMRCAGPGGWKTAVLKCGGYEVSEWWCAGMEVGQFPDTTVPLLEYITDLLRAWGTAAAAAVPPIHVWCSGALYRHEGLAKEKLSKLQGVWEEESRKLQKSKTPQSSPDVPQAQCLKDEDPPHQSQATCGGVMEVAATTMGGFSKDRRHANSGIYELTKGVMLKQKRPRLHYLLQKLNDELKHSIPALVTVMQRAKIAKMTKKQIPSLSSKWRLYLLSSVKRAEVVERAAHRNLRVR